MRRSAFITFAVFASCSGPTPPIPDAGKTIVDAGQIDSGTPLPQCLELEPIDAGAALAGRDFLLSGDIGGDFVPRLAWDNLWRVWGSGQPADLAAAMRERYGFAAALTPNDGLPIGFRQVGTSVRADCLVCHAGVVAGHTVIGAPNTRVDLELLIDDLKTLATTFGFTAPNPPALRTGSRGVADIIGMTLQLGLRQHPATGVNTEIGYQDPPAWWTIATKTRLYTDGSAPQSGHRTFMATQLAFGTSQSQLEALEPKYIVLRQWLLQLEAPPWPFTAPEPAAVERGRATYRRLCVTCHRDDRCERSESVLVPRAEVGTDPDRSANYGLNEVAVINGSWFGQRDPLRSTGAYLAPSLKGVWASAPYFHNGSVPTLAAVLDSSRRPAAFSLRGTDYDELNVGVQIDVIATVPPNPPRATRAAIYDTTKPGLHNTGHLFGDALTPDERVDLISFLKTL